MSIMVPEIDEIVNFISADQAGQEWLTYHHDRLDIPAQFVMMHLE